MIGVWHEGDALMLRLYIQPRASRDHITDDSELAVDALAGAPGIYSARYAGEEASDRQNLDNAAGGDGIGA